MKKNISFYQKEVKKNLDDITNVFDLLKMKSAPDVALYESLFIESSKVITENWASGKKYSRTFFVQKAFEEDFEEQQLGLLLSVDSMINILDDLLDENLSEEKKNNYVIELLRNFALYNRYSIPEEVRQSIGLYFNKLITLALSEKFYENKISKSNNINEIITDSVDLLNCRGMDIDAFVEIALINSKEEERESIRKAGRLFRAINIFKKDINDISYDLENGMQTVVTIVLSREDLSFSEYISGVISLIFEKEKELTRNKVTENFKRMILETEKEIQESFNKIKD